MAITWDSPVETLFGPRSQKVSAVRDQLGLATVGDLLFHLPRRYLATGELSDAQPVEGELITVVGEIASAEVKSFQNRRTNRPGFRTEIRILTGGPTFTASFFAKARGHAETMAAQMRPGSRGLFHGKVQRFKGSWQISSPHQVMFDADPAGAGLEAGDPGEEGGSLRRSMRGLMPIYPSTKGVYSWDLQRAIQTGLDLVVDVPDRLPADLRERFDVLDLATALRFVHGPDDHRQRGAGERRLRFDEALVNQLVLARRRRRQRQEGARARTGTPDGLLDAFDADLPFTLTDGQRAVGEEIAADLAREHPMNRLLQGEVGSGKTLVALRAMLRVVDSGGQAVLLAPTEVLAQQHAASLTRMLGDLAQGALFGGGRGTTLALLTGSMPRPARAEAMLRIASGEAGIVVGTHALLSENVGFADLGLVVVDEQHRFGVEQRAALTGKADAPPHVLVMTATPIPRTVAMTVFGDLETSTLREVPAGRGEVQTTVVALRDHPGWEARVWERVREEVGQGRQVFVVCPRIGDGAVEEGAQEPVDLDEDGEPIEPPHAAASVIETYERLVEGPLAGLEVAMLHGRMDGAAKEAAMAAFATGETDVLIATTVIEVGVDVPNASTMVVLDAERFGISQLHQLRGRIGRGGLPGLCLLLTHSDPGTPARERADALAETRDGFELARRDLEQRREGDVLGRTQSGGRSSLQILRVLRDEKTILAARTGAEELVDRDPDLAAWPLLRAEVLALEASAEASFLEKS